jgi:leucyl aminopeptidase
MAQARLECVALTLHEQLTSGDVSLRHALVVMPLQKSLPDELPGRDLLSAVLARRDLKLSELAKTPLALDLPDGVRCAYVMVDGTSARFEQHSVLRKAAMLLLDETPAEVALAVYGDMAQEADAALCLMREALYVLWINGAALPVRRKKAPRALKRIVLHGDFVSADFSGVAALAAANTLARQLTLLPPNELTPAHYREKVRALAKAHQWDIEEFDLRALRRMGAGAFCAVAQGSQEQDAAIVRLTRQPVGVKGKFRRIALVGKGICFDTGGHNLKPARYMAGMHEDMNGSAVALALLQAIEALRLPLVVDVWLAIAQNHLSAQAYKQNDIITALDGTHIEIVHTDAEGRLVLADALTLAMQGGKAKEAGTSKRVKARKGDQPELVIDFATLTGSMVVALGNRHSGVFASDDDLAALAVAAGRTSGERVCVFPLADDYSSALDSKVADIKQCTLDGEADHILAALFLKRFVQGAPWLHVDLAAASCKGGLGAVASDLTGFGVAWGVALLAQWLASVEGRAPAD